MRISMLLLGVPVLLAACSSTPTPPPQVMTGVHPLEQDALNALDLHLDQEASEGLDAALKRYRSLDDLIGQWRVHLTRTKLANSKGDAALAKQEVEQLERLARLLNSREADFETLILLGQIREDPRYFQSALEVAPTPLKRAVVLTYLGKVEQAMQLLDVNQDDYPADRAFVYFRYARKTGTVGDMQRALREYRIAQDSRGIADSLVSLSRLAAGGNEPKLARTYGERAINVLNSIGDSERAAAVQNWLDQI